MKTSFLITLLLIVMLAGVGFVDSQKAAPPMYTMDHEWDYDVGDTVFLNGKYYIVWKRMEALHPENMQTYYYYQLAPEGSKTGLWVWEGDMVNGVSRSRSELESSYDDPPPGFCPPNGTPPPC